METFRASFEYQIKLVEHGAGVFMIYFKEVSWALIGKGVKAAMPVFVELREALIPLEPTPQKALGLSCNVTQVLEAEVQVLAKEGVPIDDLI